MKTTTRDVLALANGIYSAHVGMDAVGNPHAMGTSKRHWFNGWRLMRKVLEREQQATVKKPVQMQLNIVEGV